MLKNKILPALIILTLGCSPTSKQTPDGRLEVHTPDTAKLDGTKDTNTNKELEEDYIYKTDTPIEVQTRYEEDCQQENCSEGWIICRNGTMIASSTGHIPCWVSDCEEHGFKWKCVSNICGKNELCKDDIKYLKSLVPWNQEWQTGRLTISSLESQYWETCTTTSCSWEIQENERQVFHLKLGALAGGDSAPVEGTTNMISVMLPATWVHQLEIKETTFRPISATLYWAPLDLYTDQHQWPPQGMSGALEASFADGSKLTVVWLWDENVHRFAIVNSPGTSPKPD